MTLTVTVRAVLASTGTGLTMPDVHDGGSLAGNDSSITSSTLTVTRIGGLAGACRSPRIMPIWKARADPFTTVVFARYRPEMETLLTLRYSQQRFNMQARFQNETGCTTDAREPVHYGAHEALERVTTLVELLEDDRARAFLRT